MKNKKKRSWQDYTKGPTREQKARMRALLFPNMSEQEVARLKQNIADGHVEIVSKEQQD